MLLLRPIGSCRLFTPLKSVREVFDITIQGSRHYGFTHSSAEALQALRFIRGEIDLPAELLPLVARSADTRGLGDEPSCEDADVVVIEICSAKNVTIGDCSLQLNYTKRHFADFFADSQRNARFNRLSGEEDAAERDAWLKKEPTFQALSPQDRELLSAMRISMLEEDEIVRDLQAIRELIGHDRIVLQTHVNALTPGRQPLQQRVNVIAAVKRAGARLGHPVFDPSGLMAEFGQMLAMGKGGADLTHFSPRFAERVGWTLVEKYVIPRAPAGKTAEAMPGGAPMLAASLLIELQEGKLAEVGARAFAGLRQNPESRQYQRLAGHICHAMGDHERAIGHFDGASPEGADDLTDEDRIAKLRCLFELGRKEEALRYGMEMLEAEIETRDVLWTCAVTATELGTQPALPFWKQLILRGEYVAEAAAAVLGELQAQGHKSERIEWAKRIVEIAPGESNAFKIAWRDAEKHEDYALLHRLTAHIGRHKAVVQRDLINGALRKSNPYSASLIFERAGPAARDAIMDVPKETVANWSKLGMARLAAGEVARAARLIRAAFVFRPELGAAKRANSDFAKYVRRSLRDAWKKRRYYQVAGLADHARVFLPDYEDFARYVGLALYRLERFPRAVSELRTALSSETIPPNILPSLARAAKRAGDVESELFAFQRFKELGLEDKKMRAFIDKVYPQAIRRGLAEMRKAAKADALDRVKLLARRLLSEETSARESGEVVASVMRLLHKRFREAGDGAKKAELAELLIEFGGADERILQFAAEQALAREDHARVRELVGLIELRRAEADGSTAGKPGVRQQAA